MRIYFPRGKGLGTRRGRIPRNLLVFASETVRFGSGKVAYADGQRVLLVFGANGTTFVYAADATPDAIRRGIGLLATYGPEKPIEIDGRRV